MNQQNPYGGQQPQQPQQGWGQQPQQQPAWGQAPAQQQPQQFGGMHPGMQTPGPTPGGAPYGGADESNTIASEASVEARSKFIERTYLHLAGAIAVFVVLSAGFQMIPGIDEMVFNLLRVSEYSWLAVMGAFIGVSYLADRWARGSSSPTMQYAGLGLYTVAEAVIFLPMIIMARQFIGAEGIMTAGGITLAMFAGLTGYVFITKKDFSFMRGALSVAAVGALGLIVASILFGFQLGILFSIGMVVVACGYILYYTGNVLHHYRVNQHVAASLALFSAVALLFWYVLRIFMSRR
ncbi:MAG: Bax inhibitor-1 family protein [Nannocystaceae bacterium]|nr:Bax inhibitor-1 family protein [Nannocystaceae bacterium]